MVADYEAISNAEHVTSATLHPAYRRQADVYQFLVAQQGLEVSDRTWVADAFREAVSLALSGRLPDPGPECAWCKFAAAWADR